MLTATFLQVFGLMYLALGLAFVVHPAQIKKSLESMAKNQGGSLLFGVLMILLGAMIIVLHSRWGTPEEVLVSLFGWAAFFKGLCYVGFPDIMEASTDYFLKTVKSLRFIGVLMTIFGVLMYVAGVL